jgi:tetratricopeptide (TPR) repeat protein
MNPHDDDDSTQPALDAAGSARGVAQQLRAFRRFAAGMDLGSLGIADAAGGQGAGVPRDAIPGVEFLRRLGAGGQGVVYEALQTSTGRRVAIKILRTGPYGTARGSGRFEREVRILSRLRHPNIVPVHDAGTIGDQPYLIMGFVEGKAIDEVVWPEHGSIPETLRLFAQVCDAVQVAHLNGVTHRDIKPSNILVDSAGVPFVVDFGLAKLVAEEGESEGVTQLGDFIGTPIWASPEQTETQPDRVDVRTDVYSLGLLLYRLLTGAMPYDTGGTQSQVFEAIRHASPRSPRLVRSDIDKDVETMVLKCLAKEPVRRYQTAGELVRDIRSYLAGGAIEARRDSAAYVLRKTIRRHRAAAAVVLAALVGLIVGGMAVGYMFREKETEQRIAEAERKSMEEARQAQARLEVFQQLVSNGAPRIGESYESARARLDPIAARVEQEFADDPAGAYLLEGYLATYYRAIGCREEAEAYQRAVVEAAGEAFGAMDERVGLALLDYAIVLPHSEHPRKIALLRESVQILETSGDLYTAAIARSALAASLIGGDLDEAEREMNRSKNGMEAINPIAAAGMCKVFAERLCVYHLLLDEADYWYREGLKMFEGLGEQADEAGYSASMNSYGVLLRKMGRLDEAENLLAKALEIRRRLYPQGNEGCFYLAATMAELGETKRLLGKLEEAEPLLVDSYTYFAALPHPSMRDFRRWIVSLIVTLYEDRDAAEPGRGYDVQAANWRRLSETLGSYEIGPPHGWPKPEGEE